MNKQKKSKKSNAGLVSGAGRFARRNRTALSVAGAGLAAAALYLGRRYRDRQGASWSDERAAGGAAA